MNLREKRANWISDLRELTKLPAVNQTTNDKLAASRCSSKLRTLRLDSGDARYCDLQELTIVLKSTSSKAKEVPEKSAAQVFPVRPSSACKTFVSIHHKVE